jgi:DNA-binding MarR family transcriptional regulator
MDPRRSLKLVKHLESLGLGDGAAEEAKRRSKPLQLTPAGQQLCERIVPTILAAQDRIMAPLSDAERETLRDLLARLVHANEARSSPKSDRKTM